MLCKLVTRQNNNKLSKCVYDFVNITIVNTKYANIQQHKTNIVTCFMMYLIIYMYMYSIIANIVI